MSSQNSHIMCSPQNEDIFFRFIYSTSIISQFSPHRIMFFRLLMKSSSPLYFRLDTNFAFHLLILIRSRSPFLRMTFSPFQSKKMLAVSVRQLQSISMKILEVAGRQSGLNFIESGQIGVIMMLSMVLHISGPLRLRLLQYDPIGVDTNNPSPLSCPILILHF